jgi:hypothetical protein
MPFVPVANTVMVEMRMLLDNQHIENTLYFLNPAGPDITNMNLLASEMVGWWTTQCAPLLPITCSLQEVVVTDLTSASSFQVVNAPAGGVPGSFAAAAMPNNVSLAISFRTATRGRSHRGRNYIPALVESVVVENTVDGSHVANWETAYNQILIDPGIIASGYVWGVVTRFSGTDANGNPIPRAAGAISAVTAASIVDPIVDSMRRRLPGRGA